MATRKRAPAQSPKATTATEAPKNVVGRLDEMSVAQLNSLIEHAVSVRDAKKDGEEKEFLERIRLDAEERGIAPERVAEMFMPRLAKRSAGKVESGKRSPAPAKYRAPDGTEWSGRGRPAKSIADQLAQGHKLEEFLIDKG